MDDMERAMRLARTEHYRKRLDRAFEKNRKTRQALFGIGLCAVAIVSQVFLDDIFWALETVPVTAMGLMFVTQ